MYQEQEEEWLGLGRVGDFEQGAGESTASLQNPNVSIVASKESKLASGPPFLQSPMVWIVGVSILVIVKVLSEKAGDAGEFRTVKIGLENFFIVGLLASLFIYAAKFASASASWMPGPIKQFFGVV